MHRRNFISFGAASVAALMFSGSSAIAAMIEKLELSEAEWKAKLSPEAFDVLRKEATERPFTSPLNDEKRKGVYACAGCDLPLFSSAAKYDSRTGWPSFFEPIEASHIGTKIDYYLLTPRTEYHCARCGGHHGHVFNDGPKPTGLRYCNNGVALTFTPTEDAEDGMKKDNS